MLKLWKRRFVLTLMHMLRCCDENDMCVSAWLIVAVFVMMRLNNRTVITADALP